MGAERSSTHTLSETLDAFDQTEPPGAPLTTSEVAEALDCARRTAYGKLAELAERGTLETKKVGARGRVWWRPPADDGTGAESNSTLEGVQFRELVETVGDYAIFVLDSDGTVQTWNEGARQLKGYEESEILGEHVSTFYTPEDQDAGRATGNLATAREAGRVVDEGWRVRKDGSRFWANVTITALTDDDGAHQGFVKITRDMTERYEYETRLRDQRDELVELDQINTVIREIDQGLVTGTSRAAIEDVVCDRLAASTTYLAAWVTEYDDAYEAATPRTWAGIDGDDLDALHAAETTGADSVVAAGATALRTRSVQSIPSPSVPGDASAVESAIAVPLVYDEIEYGVLVVAAEDPAAFDTRKTDVLEELAETTSHAIAAVRRKERERTLTALQQSTRDLLHAETREEIGTIIVETLTDELRLDDALVYSFDTSENTLEAVSSSFRTDSQPHRVGVRGGNADSPVWTAFVEGETLVTAASTLVGADGTRRAMVVPLGDHGVLTVAAPANGAFDENTRNLVALVGATAEAAFDRVENQANLRERDDLLQAQNQRLQRLNQINTIIRDVDQGLVQATTRDEIERVVCERLTRSDHFRFAWIGVPNDVEGTVTPVARSGSGRGYLDAVDLAYGRGGDTTEPAASALNAGTATVVPNVADDLRASAWRTEAFSREFQAIVAVPLTYGDVPYGVLSVYADRPGVFDEMERSVFVELGETVGNAINAVETKRALLSDEIVELEFRIENATASILGRLAQRLDTEVTFEGTVPLAGDTVRVFFVAHDAEPEDVLAALEGTVESSQVVAASNDSVLVEATVTGTKLAHALTEHGATLQSLTATPDEVRLTTDLPTSTSVRGFVEWFQQRYESAELVARRERDRPTQSRDGVVAELEAALTDRQLEVLKTAYYSGFFVSPRQSTGSDVADLLGVSQPTVSEQLRTAQRKVLDLLLADE